MSLNKKFYDDYVWALKYRPTTINDVVLPKTIQDNFNKMLSSNKIPNMLFYGQQGIGKTTIATILADTLGCDTLYINGSIETSIDVLRGKITQFVTTVSFDGGKKMVIFDEFDRISLNAMDSLKSFIEEYSKNVTFVFLTNNIHRIIEPLKSRLQTFEFTYNKKELVEMKKHFAKIVLGILDKEDVEYNKKILSYFINSHFPDMRKTLNELQKFSDRLTDPSVVDKGNTDLDTYFKIIGERDFGKIREFCANITDAQVFYTKVYDAIPKYIDNEDVSATIVLTSDYNFKTNTIKDQRIPLMAYSCELMNNVKLK